MVSSMRLYDRGQEADQRAKAFFGHAPAKESPLSRTIDDETMRSDDTAAQNEADMAGKQSVRRKTVDMARKLARDHPAGHEGSKGSKRARNGVPETTHQPATATPTSTAPPPPAQSPSNPVTVPVLDAWAALVQQYKNVRTSPSDVMFYGLPAHVAAQGMVQQWTYDFTPYLYHQDLVIVGNELARLEKLHAWLEDDPQYEGGRSTTYYPNIVEGIEKISEHLTKLRQRIGMGFRNEYPVPSFRTGVSPTFTVAEMAILGGRPPVAEVKGQASEVEVDGGKQDR